MIHSSKTALLIWAVMILACRDPLPPIESTYSGASDTIVNSDSATTPDVSWMDSHGTDTTGSEIIEPDVAEPDISEPDEHAEVDLGNSDESADSEVQIDVLEEIEDASAFRLASWNLHNFSTYGDREFRIDDIANKIEELGPDILAVQELKVAEGTNGSPPQAWDELLEQLDGYDGIHAPWDTRDTTVGFIYNTDRVTIIESDVLFESDWSAFPRPPLFVTVSLDGSADHFGVIVVHLKAFRDSLDRRVAACEALDEFIQEQENTDIVVIGDFNDDPHDAEAENAFVDTFLDSPDYIFVTDPLPPETVTSTGFYHWVDGERIDGEFLDHAVFTTGLYDRFGSVEVSVDAVPNEQFDSFERQYSDHLPLLIDIE